MFSVLKPVKFSGVIALQNQSLPPEELLQLGSGLSERIYGDTVVLDLSFIAGRTVQKCNALPGARSELLRAD